VTEHGIARLSGCTVAERAARLIAVAAPRHRERLMRGIKDLEEAT
jgi:acyl-CoA hydrolase